MSSTSDSASTQKRFNKLIDECRVADENLFGPASSKTVELIKNFCSMHLGINLRKAFLSGISENQHDSHDRQYNQVDTLVHEFCKLFGRHGTPEYGCGVHAFKDFLQIMSTSPSVPPELKRYYCTCTRVSLERQVGNRYFVRAANAAKVIFLREAAIEFLRYTGKDSGNKLETDLLGKLLDEEEMAKVRVDAMMYYHVYADLVMLPKSDDLLKSAFDMNLHYVELQNFLEEMKSHPDIVLNASFQVFQSELRLYTADRHTNHRCHPISEAIYSKLFDFCLMFRGI